MKWIVLFVCLGTLPACTYINTQLVENPQVIVTPSTYNNLTVVDEEPIDVTTTVVDYQGYY